MIIVAFLKVFLQIKKKAKIIFDGEEPTHEWIDVYKLESEYLGYAFMLKKRI